MTWLRQLPRDFSLLALSLFIWGIGEGMFLYFQPLYLEQLGASPSQIGAALGMVGVAMLLAHLPAGYLSDHLGRKPLLVASWVIATAASWVMAWAGALPLYIVGSVLYGLTGFVSGPMNAYVTYTVTHERTEWSVGRALTLISACFNAGMVLGALLGGEVAERAGLQSSYALASILFVPSTALVLLLRPQPKSPLAEGEGRPSLGTALRRLWSPALARYLGLIFFVSMAMYLALPLTANYVHDYRGLGLEQIGQLAALRGVGTVALSLVLGPLAAPVGFALAQLAVGAGLALIWLGPVGAPLAWFGAGYLLIGGYQPARAIGAALARALPVKATHAGDPGQLASLGALYGLLETVGALAIILAPLLAGWLYEVSPGAMYAVGLGAIVLGVAASLALHRQR